MTGLPASDTRSQLLEAAELTFERYGIRKTTMEDIAQAAGVSRASVYRYFEDRDSLILEIVLRHGEELQKSTREFVAQFDTFEDILVEGLLFEIEYARKDQFLHLLLSPGHIDIATRVIGSSEAAVDVAAQVWEPLIEEAQRRGEVAADLDRREARRWILLVNMILLSRTDFHDADTDTLRGLVKRFVLPAFVQGAQ